MDRNLVVSDHWQLCGSVRAQLTGGTGGKRKRVPSTRGWRRGERGSFLRYHEAVERELAPDELTRWDPQLLTKVGPAIWDAAVSVPHSTADSRLKRERGRSAADNSGVEEVNRLLAAGGPVREARKAFKKDVKSRRPRCNKQERRSLGSAGRGMKRPRSQLRF